MENIAEALMNITTSKSERDLRQEIRQLEVAVEHATAAATAAPRPGGGDASWVEVRYPSYQFRETVKALRLKTEEHEGRWIVMRVATLDGCRAACTVLAHYYPDEDFTSVSAGSLAQTL